MRSFRLAADPELTDLGRPIAARIGELIDTIYDQLPGIVAHARQAASRSTQ